MEVNNKYSLPCPQCNKLRFYKSKDSFKIAIKKKAICRGCVNSNTKKIPIPKESKRNCPKCGKVIIYKGKRNRITCSNSEKNKKLCNPCANKKPLPDGIYILDNLRFAKLYPTCNEEQSYSRLDSCTKSLKEKKECYKCSIKNPQRSLKLSIAVRKSDQKTKLKQAWQRPDVIEKHKIASNLAYKKPEVIKRHSEAIWHPDARKKMLDKKEITSKDPLFREKQRISYFNRIENGGYIKVYPNYNKQACVIFNEINSYFNWNGVHAENGGEYCYKKLFLDYYEPFFNVAIEYDEKYHLSEKIKLKDQRKQEDITSGLGCSFFRIKIGEDWRVTILKELELINKKIKR